MAILKRTPSAEEASALRECEDYVQLANSPGWKRVRERMQQQEDEALAAIQQFTSSDGGAALRVVMRYQQRRAQRIDLERMVEEYANERDRLIEELNQEE